ncbi:MAG: helix-turn-helix domain-containing protein [Mangrovicoccus sp.]
MSSDRIDISSQLRDLQRTKKITVAEMAQTAGVSKSTMEKYLAGPSSPGAVPIAKLCAEYGLSADWMITGRKPAIFRMSSSAFFTQLVGLMDLLKRCEELGQQFSSLSLGSKEWTSFVTNTATEQAFEAAVQLERNFECEVAKLYTHGEATGGPMPIYPGDEKPSKQSKA